MAAKGRNSDSMLVHMAPQEVAGLQALAMKHGGSLTINPDTGLVEANFLKKLLPAIAGFALNAFAPGFGSAIGAALGGLGGAAGTAIGLGGITGLATGSLSKGLMAGMGAYGGASLASGVMGAGASAGLENALGSAGAAEGAQGQAFNKFLTSDANPAVMSNADKLSSGFGAITKSPSAFGDFAKQNAGALLGVTSPLLADQGVETVTKMDNPGYIRNFEVDLLTQRAKALDPVSVKSLGYPGYADGGAIGVPRTVTQMPGSDSRSSSQAAYEFLMGIAPKTTAAPTTAESTSASGTTNPAAQGRYAWNSDTQSYSFVPAEGIAALAPASSPNSSYDFGGGDSGSGSGGTGASSGTGATAADSADFGDTGSSSDSGSVGDAGAAGGGGGGAADSGGTGDSGGDGAAGTGDGGSGASGGDGAAGGDGEANGGLMRLHKKFAEGGAARVRDGSSQAAYNYLMGLTNTTRPDIGALPPDEFTKQPIYIPPAAKKDDDLPTLNPFTTPNTPVTGGGGGGGITALPTTAPSPIDDFRTTTPVMRDLDDFRTTTPAVSAIDDFRTTTPAVSAIDDFRTSTPVMSDLDNFRTTTPALSEIDNFRTSTPVMSDLDNFRTSTPVMSDLDNFRTATNIDNANISVDVPNSGLTTMGDGNTQVTMDRFAQQQPAVQAAVQYEPSGGATVTMPEVSVMPETTYVPNEVADTFNPNTNTYVGVGNAGGDFGDRGDYDYGLQAENNAFANGGMPGYAMGGGLGSLGGYSDGGRLLRGPGDGVSDSIPAMIGKRQPARLADGEFVVPARIVSELGNGSTEAGARKLYKMMDRIQAARRKTVGKGRVAKNSRAEKHLPA
jgi:hypothetical protein